MVKKDATIVKVGIYLRKSRAEDGTQDLKKHKDYLIEVCNRNNWLYELYEEIDSSQDLHRAELQRLRQDIRLGKIDAVMVHAVDRLSRRSRHFLEIIEDYFIAQGMTRLFVKDTENNLLDSTTITILQLQATLSQAEYSFIISRLREGRKASAKEGIWSGKMVYGYTFDPVSRKVVTEPNEFPILRKICEMLLQGYSFNGICTELNRLGYRTRLGNEWAIHNIHSILDSPVIRGHIEVKWSNGEETIARDSHQAAITEGEYQQIQSLLKKRVEQYSNLNEAPAHFLQGLIRCSTCGFSMPIQANKFSHFENGVRIFHENGNYRYYVRKCRTKGCNNYGVNVTIVEEIVIDILKEYSVQVEEKIKLLREVNVEEITSQTVAKQKELEASIAKFDSKESGLLDLLLDNTIDKPTYNKRIQALKDNKADLIQELNAIPTIDVGVLLESASTQFDLIKEYNNLDDQDKRRLLQMIFAKILYSRFNKTDDPKLDIYPNYILKTRDQWQLCPKVSFCFAF